jgi:hypothetical protein
MVLIRKQIYLGFFLVLWALLPATWAEERADSLHEGNRLELGVRGVGGYMGSLEHSLYLGVSGDLSVLPIPGGGRLNGSHYELELAVPQGAESVRVDRLHLQALRWSHLRALGVEYDRNEGTQLAIEALGVRIPFVLAGDYLDAGSYSIGHAGASLGYQWQKATLGASTLTSLGEIHAASAEVICRVDHQIEISPRWALRSYQEASYLYLLGQESAPDVQERLASGGRLRIQGGVGLHADITRQAPFREVRRTHPATGEVSTVRVRDEGLRILVNVLDIRGGLDLLDAVDERDRFYTVTFGLAGEF